MVNRSLVASGGVVTSDSRFTIHHLRLREHFPRLANVAGRGCDDGFCVDVNLLALLNRAPDVVLAYKIHCLPAVRRCFPTRCGRRRCIHTFARGVVLELPDGPEYMLPASTSTDR